jgi:hypothetical protein
MVGGRETADPSSAFDFPGRIDFLTEW